MKKPPCANCPYLSDDKRACMFFIHKNIPFADAIGFEEGYPGECLVIEDLKSTMDRCIEEHENAWAQLLKILDLWRDLQEELQERGI